MADGDEPKPKEQEPKEQGGPKPELVRIYKALGQIINLEKVLKAKGLLIDGDLEVEYSADLKTKVRQRINDKLELIAMTIQELRNNG